MLRIGSKYPETVLFDFEIEIDVVRRQNTYCVTFQRLSALQARRHVASSVQNADHFA